MQSCNGLTRENCPYKGLGELKRAYGLVPDEWSVEKIVETLRACRDPATGDYPSKESGLILSGPLADGVRTWKTVNAALAVLWRKNPDGSFRMQSCNGLTRENCPYKGLGELKYAFGLSKGPWRVDIELPLTPPPASAPAP